MNEIEKLIAYVQKQVFGISREAIIRAIPIATKLPKSNLEVPIPDHYAAVCMRAQGIWLGEKKGW